MHLRRMSSLMLVSILSACSLPAGNVPAPLAPESTVLSASPAGLDPSAATKSIGTPVPGWENIPIMPGAFNGELEDMVYLYSVNETLEAVEQYYLTKLDVNGWAMTNRQVMETSPASGPSTVLEFQKNDQFLNIMLVSVPEENATAVLLSQLGQ